MTNKILPCNCPLSVEWFENFNTIKNYFVNAGGIAYKILKESGLEDLYFFGLFDDSNWTDGDQIEKRRSYDRIIALEVYMDLHDDHNLDKAYLFHSHTNDYYSIYKDGVIKKGKLVLTREKIIKWARLGYGCILCENNLKRKDLYEEYMNIFQGNFSCRNIKPWKMNEVTASRGYKEVFLVLDYASFGDYYFEVDFYAIDTCFDIIKKEKYIRNYLNPYFRIENVDRMDFHVLKLLEQEIEDVFLREMGYDINEFSETYRDLAYLTAYLKYYYPDISELIIGKEGEEKEADSVGIALFSNHLIGANGLRNGNIDFIKNQNLYGSVTSCIYGMDLEDVTRFSGRFSLLNAGIALSEIGISIRALLKSCTYENLEYAVICLPAYVPSKEAITAHMKLQSNVDIEIYDELNIEDADALDIVEQAVQMAGLTNYKVIPKAVAIAAAYENHNFGKKLTDGQYAFVYDWEEDYFSITLIQKKSEDLQIMWQEVIESPTINEDVYVADGKTLKESVKSTIYDIMYKQEDMLRCMNLTAENKEVWEKLYATTDRVIEQVKDDKEGILILENDWASIEEVFELNMFAHVFEPYYQKTERIMKNILFRLELTEEDVSAVYVSGTWGNCSWILKSLERFLGQNKVCILGETQYAPVIGAAYLAKNH